MNMLIVSRALQGTAGGGIMQMVNITISDLYSMRYDVVRNVLRVLADIPQEPCTVLWSLRTHVGSGGRNRSDLGRYFCSICHLAVGLESG